MAVGRFVIALGVALCLSLAVAGLYAFHEADDGRPIVRKHSDLASPDGEWIATLEEVDNGLGFGQGSLYSEVHIRRPNEAIASHGDSAESAVFYIDKLEKSRESPSLKWRDATHLVIDYDSKISVSARAGKRLTSFHGILIEYQPKP